MGRSLAEEFGRISARQHVTIRPKFYRTLAKLRRHLWLCVCGVLRSPLTLTWSHCT